MYLNMNQYFPKLYKRVSGNVKVDFIHVSKADLKGTTGIGHLRWYQEQIKLA